MAAKAPEPPKPAAAGADAAAAAAAPAAGGAKAWLPLIINVVMMPVLAYGLTQFVLVPKLKGSTAKTEAVADDGHGAEKAEGGHGEEKKSESHGEKPSSSSSAHGGKSSGGKAKVIAPLSGKVLVNVAGTLGTRYLLANITLVGVNGDLKNLVEKNDAQLRDVAAGTLAVKTIPDLEKPGARNLIRTELISVFNNVLGQGTVNDIYLTEFAVQ